MFSPQNIVYDASQPDLLHGDDADAEIGDKEEGPEIGGQVPHRTAALQGDQLAIGRAEQSGNCIFIPISMLSIVLHVNSI